MSAAPPTAAPAPHPTLQHSLEQVQLEITTRCQFHCFYCAGRDMPQRDMSWEQFESIVRAYAGFGVRVSLQGEGEPLLHRDVFRMAALIRASGNQSYTITNAGYTLTPRLRRDIPGHFDRIGISLDSVDPVRAEEIGRHRVERVMSNIETLMRLMGPSRVDIYSVDCGDGQLAGVRQFLGRFGPHLHIVQALQTKPDYAARYPFALRPEPAVRHPGCRFVERATLRYYDFNGTEMPCCHIKDSRQYVSIAALEDEFRAGQVPAVCTGCRDLYDTHAVRHAAAPAPQSSLAETVWPALLPPAAHGHAMLLWQLEQTQWWPQERLHAQQLRQLDALLRHAHGHSAYYRAQLDAAGYLPVRPLDEAQWQRLPVLRRADLQAHGVALRCTRHPAAHGGTFVARSSGSTGSPVSVTRTQINQLIFEALTVRNLLWHRTDFSQRAAGLQLMPDPGMAQPPHGIHTPGWPHPIPALFGLSGDQVGLDAAAPLEAQADWLLAVNPAYLHGYPTALRELGEVLAARGRRPPALRQLRVTSEPVTAAIRAQLESLYGVPVVDNYSCMEIGLMAMQCPEHAGVLHVLAEAVRLEVLRPDGSACAPGETGEVVVTDLHNFAQPLIRYAVGDYAEVAPPCACGRGLPALRRVLGRERNFVRLPDGSRHEPGLERAFLDGPAAVRQFQLVQHSLEEIEVRLVLERDLGVAEQEQLSNNLHRSLRHPFRLRFTRHDHLPRAASGKFEDFICLLPHT
jgi:phenylacetate-CoA ligase